MSGTNEAPAAAQDPWSLKERRILVVDDDPDHGHLLKEILDEQQAKVTHVTDGRACLEQPLEEVDLVLLDYYLPDTTGGELVPEILKRREIPIILVTVENTHEVAVGAIRQGAYDYICKAGDYLRAVPTIVIKTLERFRLAQENRRLREKLRSQIEENEKQNAFLAQIATMDPVTMLRNHRYLQDRIRTEINQAGRHLLPFSIIMLDLDHFKRINDEHGHQFGDHVLREIGMILQGTVQDQGVVGRHGGDEFIVLLPSTEMVDAVMLAQKIRGRFERTVFRGDGREARMTASFGVAGFAAHEFASRDELVRLADRAVYHSKEEGGNRVSWPE